MEANNYPFRGTLQPGPYSVGFRNTFIYDYARSYHLQVQEGETPPSHRMPRPLLVNIWYPASVPAEGNPMRLGEYFDMPSGFPDLEGFSKALGRFHVQEAAIYLVGDPLSEDLSYALDQAELDTYEEIKATPTATFRDAEPAEGEFPLVLYHSGIYGTIEDNQILCEYLASHGYVVVGSAHQPANGRSFGIDSDLERSIKDLDRIVNSMQGQPHVDIDRVGIVGHSYGASTGFAYQAVNQSVVRGVVGLDSTIENPTVPGSDYERDWVIPFRTRIYDRVQNLTVPMLIVARKNGRDGEPLFNEEYEPIEMNFSFYDKLVHAERYYMRVSGVGHNDVISQGVIESEVAVRQDPTKTYAKVVRETFDVICLYALQFFNACLKDDAAGREFLKRSPDGNGITLSDLEFAAKEPESGPQNE